MEQWQRRPARNVSGTQRRRNGFAYASSSALYDIHVDICNGEVGGGAINFSFETEDNSSTHRAFRFYGVLREC